MRAKINIAIDGSDKQPCSLSSAEIKLGIFLLPQTKCPVQSQIPRWRRATGASLGFLLSCDGIGPMVPCALVTRSASGGVVGHFGPKPPARPAAIGHLTPTMGRGNRVGQAGFPVCYRTGQTESGSRDCACLFFSSTFSKAQPICL